MPAGPSVTPSETRSLLFAVRSNLTANSRCLAKNRLGRTRPTGFRVTPSEARSLLFAAFSRPAQL